MADDEENDLLTTSRHFHNRSKGGKKADFGSTSSAFDVKKTFGSYSITVGKAGSKKKGKLQAESNNVDDDGKLELWRLTDDGLAVLGHLRLPGKLDANVLLAASRKTMKQALSSLVDHSAPPPAAPESNGNLDSEDKSRPSTSSGEDTPLEDVDEADRFATFTKNSFRSPKFWIQWQSTAARADSEPSTSLEQDSGYVVFSGNDCRKFNATLTSQRLDWRNKALQGWKTKTASDRDDLFRWETT